MRRTSAALLLLASACAQRPAPVTVPAAVPPAVSQRYSVIMVTKPAGTQTITSRGDEIVVDFEYTDRGRGPKIHSVTEIDGRGLPISIETTGNDYLKTPVNERFTVTSGVARWKNSAEEGVAPAGPFYSAMYGTPADDALLVRAALASGGTLPLFPAGTATVRKVGETTLRGTHLNAFSIAGIGFAPHEIWLDDQHNYFAGVSSWMSVIREGFENDVKTLVAAEEERAKTRVAQVAQTLMHTPAGNRLTIVNARVFDPRTGTLSAPTTINVEGERIVSLGVPQERNAADVIDAAGKVVLPGLWDMHTHLGSDDGLLNIAAGVTSVRDLGNDSDYVLALKRDFDSGAAIGPRVVLAGLVDGPGPFQGPTNILAGNEAEALKAVEFFAGRGYEGLKIYSSVVPALVPVLTKAAHEHGMRVSGHVPAGMNASQAIDAGYDEIQHANMLLLNFMPEVKDTRTPQRFTEVAARAADLDLGSPEVQAFLTKLHDRGTVIDPTLSIFEEMFTARAGKVSPNFAAVADRLPPQVRRGTLTGGLPVPEGMEERYRASFAKMLALVAEAYRRDVKIVAGTDSMAGFSLHRELELYAEAGIPNADVLRIAALVPAQILKREKDLGTIEPGKLADLILIDGNPLTNISDIRNVVTVVKGGKVFDAQKLYAELGVAPPRLP
jgi:imidazolonepropionase-like amidohydrolase